MIRLSTKTNIVSVFMLLAVAMLPMSSLWTISAYSDTEISSANIFQAGTWPTAAPAALFSLILNEPSEAVFERGEVAGASTDPEMSEESAPIVELGEPIVEITTPAQTETELSVDIGEPTVEITDPESDPQPEPTPNEESAS